MPVKNQLSGTANNDLGESLPPGIFIYRLTVDDHAESRVIRFGQKANQ